MTLHAALFDLDGTLIDTYDAHWHAWKTTCAKFGVEVTPERFSRSFGRTNPPIIRELWKECGLEDPNDALIQEIADQKEAMFRGILTDDFRPMSGATQLIRSLYDAGWAIGIGTSAPRENLEQGIDGLGIRDLLSAATCGDDVIHGKPDPEVFTLCAEKIGVLPSRCVVIEDAAAGIEAATRGGMASIGFASRGRTREELKKADMVVDSLTDISTEDFISLMTESTRPDA
jgi:beta-phosphoglucomutase